MPKPGNHSFGNLCNLRPVNNTTTTTEPEGDLTNQYTDLNTKIMKITLPTFERLKAHSRRHYNIETYDTIIKDLLDCYDKQHDNDQKWHLT
jgi:hypothetical protein